MSGTVKLGQIVCSRAGRDRGRYYLVVGRPQGRLVQVADGRHRPVARPKVKNIAHLDLTGQVAQEVAARLERGEPVSDLMVRAALAKVASAGVSWEEGD